MPTFRPQNFRWIRPGQLAGSARLTTPEEVAWLHSEGVRAVVSTIHLPPAVVEAIQAHGLEHLKIPVPDFGVPSEEQVLRFLDVVDRQVASQHAALVHCAYGIGRTGTLSVLWLMHQGVPCSTALMQVGVESRAQRQLIEAWEERFLLRDSTHQAAEDPAAQP